ncbi:MAG: hypothetical protein HJJLKODD_02302 [Phycisphaerae bacterium]|nr:hypothetical protein [Phycisphaerae bacterium]
MKWTHETNESPLLLRPKEAARMLAISPRSLWALTKAGKVPHVCLNQTAGTCSNRKTIRYPLDGLKLWIAQQSAGQAS